MRFLVAVLLPMDADCEFPASAIRTRIDVLPASRAQARQQCDPERHLCIEASDDEDSAMPEAASSTAEEAAGDGLASVMRRRGAESAPMADARGRYSRDGDKGNSSGYAETAYAHFMLVDDFSLGRVCLTSCLFDRKCGLNITPAVLMRAYVQMYGTKPTKAEREHERERRGIRTPQPSDLESARDPSTT